MDLQKLTSCKALGRRSITDLWDVLDCGVSERGHYIGYVLANLELGDASTSSGLMGGDWRGVYEYIYDFRHLLCVLTALLMWSAFYCLAGRNFKAEFSGIFQSMLNIMLKLRCGRRRQKRLCGHAPGVGTIRARGQCLQVDNTHNVVFTESRTW